MTEPKQEQVEAVAQASAPSRDWHLPEWSLLGTAIIYGASQFQVWRIKLGWDESIYFSQVSRTAPAAFFSAPRARGITWLAEPLTLVTSSVPALRVYLTVLSALALYLAFRIWFKIVPAFAVVIGAVLFASLWISRFYGAELMPNLWVLFGVVAATGGYLRLTAHPAGSLTVADGSPSPTPPTDLVGVIALPAGLALAALMRPSDAAWAAAPLLVITLLVANWRRITRLWVLIVLGTAAGATPWVIEAEQRFGGVSSRLHRASEIQGGLGWHGSVLLQHWRTLDGPLLCRPCTVQSVPPVDTWWFLLLPVAALIAVVVSRRTGVPRMALVLVPALVGLSLSVPYLLLVNYSAPRFLLPAIGLLCLPAGTILHRLVLAAGAMGRARYLVLGVLAVALAAQLVSQQEVITDRVTSAEASTNAYASVAAQLRGLGLHAPCVVSGTQSPPFAYYAGCSSRNVGGHDGSISARRLRALGRKEPVAILRRSTDRRPAGIPSWTRYELEGGSGQPTWVAYLSPGG